MKKFSIGVLGAGTWGMALARMLTVSGNDVQVWSAIEAEVDNLSATRVHPNLPGMVIPQELRFTKSIEEVCTGKDVLLFAVPSVFVRSTAAKARPYIRSGQIIVDVAKGIEPDTLYTMTEILADELSHENGPRAVRLVALSGPTHAEEVALDLPTTIVSASPDMEAAEVVQEVFSNTCMRVYTNSDIKGVELSGAMKNVIALGVGISTGLGYGDNARAALITRGIAEIARLGVAMGCNVQTFAGLAGIGDCMVLLSAFVLGPVWGTAAGGIGSALADVICGYFIYAPGTLVIKALMALAAALIFCAFAKNGSRFGKTFSGSLLGSVAAEIIMVVGYFLYELPLFGYAPSLESAVTTNLPQAAVGLVAGMALFTLLDRTHLAARMKGEPIHA